MRAFIAVSLPENLKLKLSQIQKNLKTLDLEFKWVEPQNLHLTLKFLGDTDEKLLGRIKKIIAETALSHKAFKVNLESFGFFPHPQRPRVFFVSTSNENLLKNIAGQLESGLEEIGFPVEGRFKSHLTLARIKGKKNLEMLLEKIKQIKLEGDFTVKELALYESRLKPFGAVYEKITSINLTV